MKRKEKTKAQRIAAKVQCTEAKSRVQAHSEGVRTQPGRTHFIYFKISECQAPLHKCKASLAYKRLPGDGSVATPSFSLAISLITTVRF